MTDEQKQAGADAAGEAKTEENSRNFGLQRIYLKDISFESPRPLEVFQGEWKPAISVNIGTRSRALGDDLHEVCYR
jgi:preprotein translocase subunit SecB